MRRTIDLELPSSYFEKDKDNELEARLAKFDLDKGDIIRFHETDNKGKRTGRHYDKKVVNFHKIHKATKYWKKKDLLKYGLYIFQLGTPK